MRAFHDDEKIKEKYLKRVQDHALADEIVKGQYWENGKGCAIGCSIHGSDHNLYEVELGIPEWLARVEDTIFEGLPNESAKLWPEKFLAAIKPGQNLENVKTPFLIIVLENSLKSLDALPDMTNFADVKNAINLSREAVKEMIRCHREGLNLSQARSAARAAAWSARAAAWSARAAAWSARAAAWSQAWSAAWSAAESARSADSAARSAARAAEEAAYEYFAAELLKLLDECR